jgi:hypothetical protein
MLREALSTGLTSLLEGEVRACMVTEFVLDTGVYATASCVSSSRIYPAAVWNSIPRPGAQNLRLVSSLSRPADWVQLIDFIELGSSYGSHSDANREWTPESVELYTQATLQSAFIFAKAKLNPEVAAASFCPPRRYLELLFNKRSGTALQCMDRVQRHMSARRTR